MDRLSLYFGDNLFIRENLVIKHPTLLEIKKLGYDLYCNYISKLILSPKDIADILWFENEVWYEDLNHWHFFLEMFQSSTEISDALKWFTEIEFQIFRDDKNIYYLYNKEKNIAINEYDFSLFRNFIKQINFISIKSDLDLCGNKRTKIYFLKQMSKKRKKNSDAQIDLVSIVSSLDWKACKGNEIWNIPIYRIYDGYFRLCQIDNYDKTMTALYSGAIDTSKNPIDFEKINWSNILTI